MDEKITPGYDKDGNIVFFNEKGEEVGRLIDPITEQLKEQAKEKERFYEEQRRAKEEFIKRGGQEPQFTSFKKQ